MNATIQNPIEKLVATLDEQRARKRDLILPASKLKMTTSLNMEVSINDALGSSEYFAPNELMETQLAEKLGIPMNYYRKMKSVIPNLLTENVNGWLDHNQSKKYLLRTFTNGEEIGTAIAFLSDRYNLIDNYDVLTASLDAINQTGVNVEVRKAEVSETKMYLHVVCPEVEQQAEEFLRGYLKDTGNAQGNGIISGFVITNSEVGKGAFEIRPRAVIVKCNNGLIVADEKFRKLHLGATLEPGEVVWSERTKQKNYELIISQTKDAIKTYLSPEFLGNMIEKIARLNEIELTHPIDTVQNVCVELGISEQYRYNVISNFLKDGSGQNGLGIFQAVTREAQNMEIDKQDEVEQGIVPLLTSANFLKKFDKIDKN